MKFTFTVERPMAAWLGHPEARFVRTVPKGLYVGMFDPQVGHFRVTKRSKFGMRIRLMAQLRAVFAHVVTGKPLRRGLSIEIAGRCATCKRLLTGSQSIAAGLGPSCARKRCDQQADAA